MYFGSRTTFQQFIQSEIFIISDIFIFSTILTGIQTDGVLSGRIQVERIKIREDGKLVIKFKTQAKYRGLFVQSHRTLPTKVSFFNKYKIIIKRKIILPKKNNKKTYCHKIFFFLTIYNLFSLS